MLADLHNLMGGFADIFQLKLLLFAFAGCVIGTLVGILPGIGPVAGTALLLPLTVGLDPAASIIMLAAIYYGAMYGGTLTSVLINVPGEAASAITCLDGYQMAKRGRAGVALAIAAIGSFIGGTISAFGLALLATPFTTFALKFGPPEFFCLMLVGLSLVVMLASTSIVRALMSALLGLLVAMIGLDVVTGAPRFSFGMIELYDGIDIVAVAVGLFGVAEILVKAEEKMAARINTDIKLFSISREDARRSAMPILRGTGIGFLLGLVPGVNAMVPTAVSYVTEKRVSKTPENFGTGMIEGVAGPETANNAYSNAALIPLFTLGIPGSPTVAIIMSAFLMNGLIPGPTLFTEHSQLAWTVIASLYVGNVMLLILNLPLIPLWVRILDIPYEVLSVLVIVLCIIGAYSIDNSTFGIATMLFFGVLGYWFRKADIPAAPFILTVVLGPLMESSLRQTMEISQGTFAIFLGRPISMTLLAVAALLILASLVSAARNLRGGDSEV